MTLTVRFTTLGVFAVAFFLSFLACDDDGDGTLVVTAENVSSENIYVQSVRLNGDPLASPWFRREDIGHGGTLELVIGPAPSDRGTRP